MIKEIFDIEPRQKNTIIIIVGIFGLSFLQLYLFKKTIFDIGIFFSIGVSLGLTVCWTMLNIPSLILNYLAVFDSPDNNKNDQINYEIVIFIFGLLALGWISLLTYVAFELNFNFRYFIRLSVLTSIIRTLFWFTWLIVKNLINKK